MQILQVTEVDRATYKFLVGRLERYVTTNEVLGRTTREWLIIEDCFKRGLSITACVAALKVQS